MSATLDATAWELSETKPASQVRPVAGEGTQVGACLSCLRRAWLLTTLAARLDYRSRDLTRFWDLLSLPDEQLIDAIGGRRRAEIHARYDEFDATAHAERERSSQPPEQIGSAQARAEQVGSEKMAPVDVEKICRHHPAFPGRLRHSTLAPHMLSVAGGVHRLAGMLEEPVVAIVGTRRATDHGMETARHLARGLAATGVTIAGALSEGIPLAVHWGALDETGRSITVTAGGLGKCSPAHCRAVYRRLSRDGCALTELPLGAPSRRWSALARVRTLALLAQLVIVVEADSHPWELACAHLAQRLGVPIAAVPGRVSSPASRGCNELIMAGAALVRNPQDALDLLYGAGVKRAGQFDRAAEAGGQLDPSLAGTLEHIGAGHDTLERLTATGGRREEILISLLELELRGLVVRGDGGRYVPCGASPTG